MLDYLKNVMVMENSKMASNLVIKKYNFESNFHSNMFFYFVIRYQTGFFRVRRRQPVRQPQEPAQQQPENVQPDVQQVLFTTRFALYILNFIFILYLK